MKKIILLLLAFMPLFGFAQSESIETPAKALSNFFKDWTKAKPEITRDDVSGKGVRWVWSSHRISKVSSKAGTNYVGVEIAGRSFKNGAEPEFLLYFRFHDTKSLKVEKNDPILFKFCDDSVYEGVFTDDREDYLGTPFTFGGHVVMTYDIYPSMVIDEAFLNSLKKGLTKMRFEINDTAYDVVLKKDNLSQFILDSYELVKQRLSEKKDFRDGF